MNDMALSQRKSTVANPKKRQIHGRFHNFFAGRLNLNE